MGVWSAQAPQAKFFGAYEHSLDVKGRITLPAKFRSQFPERCFVTRSQFGDACAVIWTPDDFVAFTSQISAETWADESDRKELRTWAREAYDVEIDKIGRMALPSALRLHAGLSKDVLVQGAFGSIELWDPQRWIEYSGESAGARA